MKRKLLVVSTAIAALVALLVGAGLVLYVSTELPLSPRPHDPFFPAVFVPSDVGSDDDVVYDFAHAPHRAPDNVLRSALPLGLEQGWSGQEVWGTWTVGATTVFWAWWPQPEERRFSLRGWALAHPQHPHGQRVSVVVNGRDCGEMSFTDSPATRHLVIPAAAQVAGANRIELHHAYTASPAELGLGGDDRPLALGVCSLGFTAGDVQQRLPSRRSRRVAALLGRLGLRSAPFTIDREQHTLTVRTAGTVVLPPLDPPGEGPQLVSVRADSSYDLRASTLRLVTVGVGGGRRQEMEVHADAWQREEGGRGWRTELEVDPRGSLSFIESHPVPDETRITFSSPMLASSATVREAPVDHGTQAGDGHRPDIVLITLDAARPDHFGCYGYHRDTTPRIDALAEEGLLFSAATALAPYTLCSVPTMLTGRCFLHHGVVQPGHALSPQATTLAETLAAHGYQTVALTATPNNSRSLRLDQGYELFVEMWQQVEGPAAIDPHRMVEDVIRFLERRNDERPLHLQIHMVPPHEPYDPPPRFDIFGDPAYTGGSDGSRTTLEGIDRGLLQPEPADIEEITALYDGNLLRADHAVGVLLDALAARERWHRTVVLLTADHGEAFFEHGRMGHNSTCGCRSSSGCRRKRSCPCRPPISRSVSPTSPQPWPGSAAPKSTVH